MNYSKKFKVGEQVTITEWKELKYKYNVDGEVIEVGDESILIQWPDLKHPTEYDLNDFDAIEHKSAKRIDDADISWKEKYHIAIAQKMNYEKLYAEAYALLVKLKAVPDPFISNVSRNA